MSRNRPCAGLADCSPATDETEPHNKPDTKNMNTTNETEYAPEVLALAKYLDCDPSELSEERYDHYGLPVYSLGSKEYAIGTDEEADAAARAYVESSLWAFNADFILSECELPLELEDGIRAMQEKKCEDCNDAMLALVEKTCGLESFVQSAISADGRGHFLAQYDGNECEAGEFYAYRI